jgi:hypothetical protein
MSVGSDILILLNYMSTKTMILIIAVVLLLIVSFTLYTINRKSTIRNAEREEDKVLVEYDLDGVAKVSLPKSFVQNTHDLISKNYYYLDLSGDSFVYSFTRDAYNHIGGESDPVTLNLDFYKTDSKMPSIDKDNYERHFAGSSFENLGQDIYRGTSVNPDPKVDPYDTKGILVYTDPASTYRISMIYWHTHLTDESALKMFKIITQSVVQKSTLSKRIDIIEKEFYEKNPDKLKK